MRKPWIAGVVAAALAAGSGAGAGTITAWTAVPQRIVSRDDGGRLVLWDFAGTLQAGWPVAASGAWPCGTPRLQDLDGDGQPEVVCLVKTRAGGREIRAWRLDGRPFPGYEALACPSDMEDTPERADVEQSGTPRWVWATSGGAVAVSPVGDPFRPRSGFPVHVSAGRLRLRIADAYGDGVAEVLGGVEDGATGRWFVLSAPGGEPTLFLQAAPCAVVAAPQPAALVRDAPPGMLVTLSDGVEAWASDGVRGFGPMPGWPVRPSPGAGGDAAFLPGASPKVAARGATGRVAAYTPDGQELRELDQALRFGGGSDYADLSDARGPARWVARSAGNRLVFQVDAGVDSAGRPRLYTRELGDRHHAVYSSAPAGLLPPVQFHFWLNGVDARAAGAAGPVAGHGLHVRGALDQPLLAGDPEITMKVLSGPRSVGACRGRGALDLGLDLENGRYVALGIAGADTLGRAEFTVQNPLALRNVFPFPSPMQARTALLFDLGADADVSADLYTVAGRRIRSLSGHFTAGRCQLGWDGTDAAGRPVANGVYLYRIVARAGGSHVESLGKLVRLN